MLLFADTGAADKEVVARLGGCGRAQQRGLASDLRRQGVAVSSGASPYIDPSFASIGLAAVGTDVFSLGVVLLEVLLGRSAHCRNGHLDADPTQTRRPRPKKLWAAFREKLALADRQGTSPASQAIKRMLPIPEWGAESLQAAADLLPEMLEIEVRSAQADHSLMAAQAAHSLMAVVPPPRQDQVPSRPALSEVMDRLEVAVALQAAHAASGGSRERVCVICMDAQVDARMRPCQHAVLCSGCASFCVGRGERCPICRGVVQGYDVGDFQSTFAF